MTAAQKQIAVIDEVPSKETALEVYTGTMGLDPWIEKIRSEALSLVPDTSTKKGRDAIASMAYKVRQAKSALDKVGKELVDRLKEQPKLVDAERKRMREILDALAEQVRKPLDEFEAKEAARIEQHRSNVDSLRSLATEGLTASDLLQLIAHTESVPVDETWEEFEAEAHRVKASTLEIYREAFKKREQYEIEQAELARLRAEAEARAKKDREEQIAREAAEKAKREAEEAAAREKAEAEAKAKAEREAAERRELELKLQAEQAERQRLAAEQAQKDAEAARIKAEQEAKAKAEQAARDTEARLKREAEEKAEAERREAAKREANKKHLAKVNNEAAAAFVVAGFSEEDAKQIVILIAQGKVPNVKISY